MCRGETMRVPGALPPTPALLAIAVLVVIGAARVHAGVVIHVPGDVAAIQRAIELAPEDGEIVVAPGRYMERIDFLGKRVTVRSVAPDDSSVVAATVIDGGAAGSVVSFVGGEGRATLLDGVTLTNGRSQKGGGVYCNASGPTIRRCVIAGNGGGSGSAGGGLYLELDSHPWLDRCLIYGNEVSGDGGGIYAWLGSRPLIEHCTIAANRASVQSQGGFGGGFYCRFTGTDPIIRDSTIVGNEARFGGGGIYCGSGTSPVIENCLIAGNACRVQLSGVGGGGVHLGGVGGAIHRCIVRDNQAETQGGGLDVSGPATISLCVISGNNARLSGGGVLFRSAGGQIVDSLLHDNTATSGGGVAAVGAGPLIRGCTITRNTADEGGALYVGNAGQPMVVGSILWENGAPLGGEVAIAGADVVLQVHHSIVAGGAANVYRRGEVGTVDWGEGNRDTDPRFVAPDGRDGLPGTVDDDFRLRGSSPAANVGDPTFVPLDRATDLEGHARLLCDVVDMGAYESGLADYNCDGRVGLEDFQSWEACNAGPGGAVVTSTCLTFDADGDLDVDLEDAAGLQRAFVAPE